jgi:hypothetical protein
MKTKDMLDELFRQILDLFGQFFEPPDLHRRDGERGIRPSSLPAR